MGMGDEEISKGKRETLEMVEVLVERGKKGT